MKKRLTFSVALCLFLSAGSAFAYPPAPFHRIYGTVRDDHGNPLAGTDALIILAGTGNVEIVRSPTDSSLGAGINYSLSVPMDAGVTDKLYNVSALRPAYPFTLRVVRGGVSYLPIQMNGTTWNIGSPAGSTRIDLTLGIDSDGDGLPDAWEREAILTDTTGRYNDLASIRPGDDADGDGLTNLQEYIAGTYAMDSSDGLFLKIVSVANGVAKLEFLAVAKRTYQLKSSPDLKSFSEQPFSLTATAASPIAAYLAKDTRVMEIYVNVGDAKSKVFRLHAN